MGMTTAGEYQASPEAMTEGQKRNNRLAKHGGLVAQPDGDRVSVTPVLDAGNIYADNDVLFIAIEITNFFRVAGGKALLRDVLLFDGGDQGQDVTLFLTTNSTTPGTINGAISAADTVFDDTQAIVRIVAADYEDLINSQVANVGNINKVLEAAAGSTSLYVWGAVRSGTPTYAGASDIVISFGVEHLG